MSNDVKLERSELAMKMLAAWLNVSVDQIPPENRAHHNPVTMEAWRRVGEAAIRHASETTRHQPKREAVLDEVLSQHGLVLTDDPDFDHDEQTFEKAKASFVAALTTPAPAVARDEIDQLVGYAAHDDDCAVNVPVSSGKCSCGLTDLLSRLRGEG